MIGKKVLVAAILAFAGGAVYASNNIEQVQHESGYENTGGTGIGMPDLLRRCAGKKLPADTVRRCISAAEVEAAKPRLGWPMSPMGSEGQKSAARVLETLAFTAHVRAQLNTAPGDSEGKNAMRSNGHEILQRAASEVLKKNVTIDLSGRSSQPISGTVGRFHVAAGAKGVQIYDPRHAISQ